MAIDMNPFESANIADKEQRRRKAYVPARLGSGASVRELTKGSVGSSVDGSNTMAMN